MVALAGCGSDATTSEPTTPTSPPVTTEPPEWEAKCPGFSWVQVIYRGEGSARSASFTAAMPDGTSQGEFSPPLENRAGDEGLRFCADMGEFTYLSIQNGTDAGDVTCKIEIDGVVVAENTSTGDYAIADCSAT